MRDKPLDTTPEAMEDNNLVYLYLHKMDNILIYTAHTPKMVQILPIMEMKNSGGQYLLLYIYH